MPTTLSGLLGQTTTKIVTSTMTPTHRRFSESSSSGDFVQISQIVQSTFFDPLNIEHILWQAD
jgi:hypothetical protein